MQIHLLVTRLYGFCWAAGAFLLLGVQPQAHTAVSIFQSSQTAPVDNRKEGGRPVTVEIPAVSYSLGGKIKVEFSPTNLIPSAQGQGQVKASKESVSVNVQFSGLESPTKFGNEFLTYVLWGSVPNGRTLKIGDLTLEGDRGRLVATTVLRRFAMMVTAKPYAAVTHPSSIIILKGSSSTNDNAQTELAHFELGDAYAPAGYNYEPLDTSSGYPPEIIQAMNARRIAKVAGAEKYASEKFSEAEELYQYMVAVAIGGKKVSKQTLGVAKNVAQGYEEARELSIRNQQRH